MNQKPMNGFSQNVLYSFAKIFHYIKIVPRIRHKFHFCVPLECNSGVTQ